MTQDRNDKAANQRTITTTGPAPLEPHSSCLIVIRGPGIGQRVNVGDQPVLIGRDPEADGGFSWERTDLAEALKRAV